ncbi:DUF3530 family protein [Marinobacter xestospongiae]|uniref:DUF3530 family protein n=1 Tax=Marinobacter xestospongiae TaxID=994319 RepID=A0ABU3VW73_9GAMM|nr:DUF3530 family protein [Marinobacter xestospongiae]MDV2078528.1 DUF3530 family protein [Marinobacter xestospongiae]
MKLRITTGQRRPRIGRPSGGKRLLTVLMAAMLAVPVLAQEASDAPEAETDDTAEAASTMPRRAPVDARRLMISTGLGSRALAARYPDAAVWLQNSEGGDELALLEREQRAPAKGAVLILGAEGQSAASGLAGAMREALAARGWAAMTLGLPVGPGDGPPPAPASAQTGTQAAAEPDPDPTGGEAANPALAASGESSVIDVMAKEPVADLTGQYRERVASTLSAARSRLQQQGYQRVVLVGVGRAAMPVWREAQAANGRSAELVWIAPRFAADERQAWPASLEGQSDWQVLDLAPARAQPEVASQRAAVFRRQGIQGYQQQAVAMAALPTARDARQVVSRLVAWLQRED